MKKKIIWFAVVALLLASCSARLTEKVMDRFPNGQPQVVRYCDKHDNCLKEVEYYSTGQVKMEGGMKDGQREGEWKAYFPDGRTQSIGTFEKGKRTGKATVWQENGQLFQEGFYKGGKHVGKWRFYNEQGELLREVDYGE